MTNNSIDVDIWEDIFTSQITETYHFPANFLDFFVLDYTISLPAVDIEIKRNNAKINSLNVIIHNLQHEILYKIGKLANFDLNFDELAKLNSDIDTCIIKLKKTLITEYLNLVYPIFANVNAKLEPSIKDLSGILRIVDDTGNLILLNFSNYDFVQYSMDYKLF